MKLSNWNKSDSFMSDEERILKESNILEANRFIYLFFDDIDILYEKNKIKNGYEDKNYIGKAILVNTSISKGICTDITPLFTADINSNNISSMLMNMYIFDVVIPNSMKNVKEGMFILSNSISSCTLNDYDLRKNISCGSSFYSKEIRDNEYKKEFLDSRLLMTSPNIPDPKFYTQEHQNQMTGEYYCITSFNVSLRYEGNELIDDFTTVSIMNMNAMDTMIPQLRDKIYKVRYDNEHSDKNLCDPTELSDLLLYNEVESMQHGFTYIYDTQMGSNILTNGNNTYLPFRKYRFNDEMKTNIERTNNNIIDYCRYIEQIFGSLRLTITPTYYGDKIDVFFKDSKPENQPVLKNNISIDNETKVVNEISSCLDESNIENELLINEENYYAEKVYGGV